MHFPGFSIVHLYCKAHSINPHFIPRLVLFQSSLQSLGQEKKVNLSRKPQYLGRKKKHMLIAFYEWGASATGTTLIVVSSSWHKINLSYILFLIMGQLIRERLATKLQKTHVHIKMPL
jgi:hypothetical protein